MVEFMDFATELRKVGLRATQPRLAALAEIEKRGHVTVDELRDYITSQIGSVSVQAVYDIVHALTDKKILREIRPVGLPNMYEIERHDNHHHVVCRECGRVEDVPCAVGYKPCLNASNPRGYVIDEAEVIYWGVCPSCQGK
ncbi:transcriptional repressor [Arcanobacterium haemolyticum]|nr:transcriptional repressor [Arcanobacterium haemolyticum]